MYSKTWNVRFATPAGNQGTPLPAVGDFVVVHTGVSDATIPLELHGWATGPDTEGHLLVFEGEMSAAAMTSRLDTPDGLMDCLLVIPASVPAGPVLVPDGLLILTIAAAATNTYVMGGVTLRERRR